MRSLTYYLMGNKVTALSFISCILFAALAVFLLSPQPASAARTNAGPASLAFSIIDKVNQRLCERQASLGNRLRIPLIHPSKCVTTPPTDEPVVTLTASPTTISAGESTTLTWTSEDATSCTAFLGWTGTKALNGSQSVSPTVTTTYQLDCTGPGGVGSDDAVVTVTVVQEPEDPSVDITANPMTINSGSTSVLTWDSTNATTCTASNGWTGTKTADGTESVSPTVTTTYAISCTGAGGTATDSVSITVDAVTPNQPTVDLTASRTSVTPGADSATTTLTWTSTNATSCTASGGTFTGAKGTSGAETITPSATTTYTLTCTGAGGDGNDSVTVNFVPTPDVETPIPTVTLTANPTSVQEGGAGNATTTLTWTSSNATSCTGFGLGFAGAKATSGSEVVTPTQNTTYQLDCVGAGGTGSDDAVVTFVPEEEPSSGNLLINEVMYDVAVPQSEIDHEWIELYNDTGVQLDLSGYSIHDNNGFDYIPNGTLLPAGAYLFVTASSTTESFWTIPAGAVKVVLADGDIGGNGFANTGDTVLILNAASSTVDHVSWGTNTAAFTPSVFPTTSDDNPGSTIQRTSNTTDTGSAADWVENATPTPGQ